MASQARPAAALQIVDSIAVVTLDNPPVNGLSLALRSALMQILQELQFNRAVEAVVLRGAGRGFSAGGDISELGTSASSQEPGLSAHVQPAIESSRQPVIAALHGFCIGGGLETALACHYRIASVQARLALPEVQLGILPLSGTQRIPRVLDFARALQLILHGHRFEAAELTPTGLIDRLIAGERDILEAALSFAREIAGKKPPTLVRDRPLVSTPTSAELAATRATYASAAPAVRAALEAVCAAYESPSFEAGMTHSRALYESLEGRAELRSARDSFLGNSKKVVDPRA